MRSCPSVFLVLAVLSAVGAACDDPLEPRVAAPASDAPAEALAPPQVCVVRHAEAFRNLDLVPDGMSPEDQDALTERGEGQARALAARMPPNVTVVWTSATERTRQTAEHLQAGPAVVTKAELRALDGNLSWETRRGAAARGDDDRPEGGESLFDGAERARRVLAALQEALDAGQNAVLVTHADMASLLLGELHRTPLLSRPETHELRTGAMECRELDTGEPSE